MNVRIESSWQQRLQSEFDKPYFENLTAFVRHEYATKTVYPPGSQIFAAFDACPFDQVKVGDRERFRNSCSSEWKFDSMGATRSFAFECYSHG